MKSLVTIYNPNSSPVVIGDFLFNTGIPVVVYRNTEIFGDEDNVAALISHVNGQPEDVEGDFPLVLVAITFDGSTLSPVDATATINNLASQFKIMANKQSYSLAYWWNQTSCQDMLDGMQKQLDQFDFGGPEVMVPRVAVMEKALMTVTMLNAGFLRDALDAINQVQPDTDFDFLSAQRLGQFKALFTSALEMD